MALALSVPLALAPVVASAAATTGRIRRARQVGARAGAVARAGGGVVAPQRLDRELRAVVAGDVAHRAGDRLDVRLTGQTRDQRLADPRALVAVLVGVDRVVPAAEVGRAAADDVLCARIGDRLLDLVTQDDRLAVELAGGAAVDGVLAADIRAAGVDRQDVRHVRV